ncbi:unnamed protein product [Ectocarpus sp. 13 AM-2016]
MSLERISSMAGRQSCEDPLQEIAILQFLKAHESHPNVIEVVEVCYPKHTPSRSQSACPPPRRLKVFQYEYTYNM